MWNGKTLTPSNLLSILRIILLIPIYRSLSQNTPSGNAWALFFMLLAVISDFFDGYLARRLRQVSDLGKTLDPLADKICIIGVSLILASPVRTYPLPMWFLTIVLLREILIVGGGFLIFRRHRLIVASNIWGKITTTMLAVLLISYVVDAEPLFPGVYWLRHQFLLWLSLLFMLISSLSYAWRFYTVMGEPKSIIGGNSKALDSRNL